MADGRGPLRSPDVAADVTPRQAWPCSSTPPPLIAIASNPPSAHSCGSGVPPWHPVPLRATHRRIRVGARGDSRVDGPPHCQSLRAAVVANASHPPSSSRLPSPLHGHRAGAPHRQRTLPKARLRQASPDPPRTRHLRHRGPHEWEGTALPSAVVPLPCTVSCTLDPPPPSGLAAPTPSSDCRRATPSPVSPYFLELHTTALLPPAPRPFTSLRLPATRTTPPASPPRHPKRILRSR